MKKVILKVILSSSPILIFLAMIIIIPILMIYNYFGGEITDTGYIEGNMEYAEDYKNVLNKYITNDTFGYVPLSRILYFYLEDESLSFDSIYNNNIDYDMLTLKPISDVCIDSYKNLSICKIEEIEESGQSDEYSYKPFTAPIDFKNTTITSFFGVERIVFDTFDIHYGWDFASPANTDIYSVGNGVVKTVRFNENKNETDTTKGYGNYIVIEYEIENQIYEVLYGHLYPNSSRVEEGDFVTPNQVIAGVGTTGYSTGNHLHWQVKSNGKLIDGMNLVDFSMI